LWRYLTGERGSQGIPGATGAIGQTGAVGAIGQTGSKGDRGETGSQGIQGIPGAVGATGNQGLQGIPGAVGAKGDIGARGIQGVPGATGPTGATGAIGTTGAQGNSGATGQTGAKGDRGEQGIQGIAGVAGAPGQPGAKGDRGEVGVNWRGTWAPTTAYIPRDCVVHNGSSYIAAVANTNSVPATSPNWTFLAAQGVQGAQGNTGIAGLKGDKGDVGDRGLQGLQGLQGPQGTIGLQGAIGLQGISGVKGDSIRWRGAWNLSTAYLVSDGISYNGSSYVAVVVNTNTLPGVSANWMLLAQQGASAPGPKCSIITIPLTYNGNNLIQQSLGFHSTQVLGITGTCHMNSSSQNWVMPPGGYANGVPPIPTIPSLQVQTVGSNDYSFAAGSSSVQIILRQGAFNIGQVMTFKILVWYE